MTHHVLLAGCGDVGIALGERLSQQGWTASGIRRSVGKLPKNITPIRMDLTNPGNQDLPKADAVVITLTADGRDVVDYQHTYLGALKGLYQALQTNGVPSRTVLVSSTGVLGDEDGETLTEDSEPHPTRATAKILLEAEHLAQALFPGVIIVRPAGIYGPGRTSLINRVRQGSPMNHARMTNRIHRDDLVTVLQKTLEAHNPPSLLHAVDTEPARMGDVAAYIAHLLHVPVPPDQPGGQEGKTLDSTRMQDFVGQLLYPTYREGYGSLLE